MRLRPRFLDIGLVLVVVVLAAGIFLGRGIAQTNLATPDSLTWLRNLRGEITRVNPDAGTPTDRLPVAAPGSPLRVVQGNGVLVVTNLRTNEILTIDLSMVRISGARQGGPDAVKVLLTMGEVYLADMAAGRIDRIDALSAATLGQPWRAGRPLADVVADTRGSVWALDEHGQVSGLRWSPDPATLVEREHHQISGAGAKAVLVPHDEGVTVLDSSGKGGQFGTGQDHPIDTGPLTGPLVPADSSPRGLVPVSTPQVSSLQLIRDTGVVTVDTAALGCRQPGRAAVYSGRVYAPCPGDRKVVVLDRDGHRAAADLPVAAGPEIDLVSNAGLLIVSVPGDPNGLVVRPDGSTRPIRTDDPGLPVLGPTNRPTAPPNQASAQPGDRSGQNPTPRTSSTRPNGQPTTGGPTVTTGTTGTTRPSPGPTASPSPTRGPTLSPSPTTSTTTTRPPRPEDLTPTGVTAQARSDGSVLVSWTPAPVRPTGYRILRTDTGEQVATAVSGATSAIVTGLPQGLSTSFVVEAVAVSGSYRSQPSNTVSAYGRPGGPSVSVQVVARAPATLTLRISVGVVDDGGSRVTSFDTSVTDGGGRTLASAMAVPIGQNPYQATIACRNFDDVCLSGGVIQVSATLYNAAGAGPPATVSSTIDPPPPWQYDGSVMIVSAGLKCLDGDLKLHTCIGTAGQFWSIRRTGDIRDPANRNQCLASNGGFHFATDSCTERAKRWDLLGVGNTHRVIRNQETSRCIFVNGDVAGEGVQVLDRNCLFNDNESFAFFTQTIPLTAAVSAQAAGPGPVAVVQALPVEAPVAALLLLPVVVGVVRRVRSGRSSR